MRPSSNDGRPCLTSANDGCLFFFNASDDSAGLEDLVLSLMLSNEIRGCALRERES